MIARIFLGLAVVRVSLGLMHGDFSDYTVFAMSLEAASLAFLIWYLLLRKASDLSTEMPEGRKY